MRYVDELERILSELGNTADEVSARLRACGIQGTRHSVRFLNPIVRYIQQLLRLDDYRLDLIQPHILRMVLPDGGKVETPLPRAVSEFLAAFHSGAYPDLISGKGEP